MSSAKPHICFVSPTIWPVFASGSPLHAGSQVKSVGGAEVQQSLLARTFVRAGYPVSIITMNFGQAERLEIDGVQIYSVYKPGDGLPGVRFIYPRLTSLWSTLKQVNADVYYQRACGMLTGVVAHYCRNNEKRFIYAAASDADFEVDLPLIKYARDKWLYRYGLRHASAVVVQNERQQQACLKNYKRTSTLIKSGYEVSEEAGSHPEGYVLWAATLKELKRPELFIELARRLPHIKFRMVGGGEGSSLYERMKEQANHLPNIEFMGFKPYGEMNAQFDGARLFVNTSTWEGFPNTFLQAWARGIPTVSFFDTGSEIHGERVVSVATDFEHMVSIVHQLMMDKDQWEKESLQCKACYTLQHRPEAVLADYEKVILARSRP